MDRPSVSVILPVYNGEKTLALCLNSLINLDYPKEKIEIIVVDNNSTDRTKDIIKRYKIRYLLEPKRGAPFALNRGIQNSRGEIIAFIHQDCLAESNWLKNLVQGFTDNSVGGCGGETLGYNPHSWIERYSDYRGLYFQNSNFTKDTRFLPWFILANSAFQRSVLYRVGLLDGLFDDYDIDLSLKVYLSGYQLKYIKEAIVYHQDKATLVSFWCHRFKMAVNIPKFVKKYGKIYEALYIVPYKNVLYIFFHILWAGKSFLRNLFVKDYRQQILFPLLDIVTYLSLFLGSLFGWVKLKLPGKNIQFQPIKSWNKIITCDLGEEIIIVNLPKSTCYNLEGTGKKIWQLLLEKKKVNEVMDIISANFEKDREQKRKDIIDFLDELKKAGLIGAIGIENEITVPKG